MLFSLSMKCNVEFICTAHFRFCYVSVHVGWRTVQGEEGLTESEAKRLSWSALQIAAVPPGPWFVPAIVVITRLLIDGDAAAFRLDDLEAQRTLVHHSDPTDWLRPCRDVQGLTIQLPSRVGYERLISVWPRGNCFRATDRLLMD